MANDFDGVPNADLVKAYIATRDGIVKACETALAEKLKPHKAFMEAIENEMLARSLREKTDSFATESGTCYKSRVRTVKVKDVAQFLPWLHAQGTDAMIAMLTSAVSKDAVYEFIDRTKTVDENGNEVVNVPPGLELGGVVKMNFKAK
jgi:hypothetical protein